MNETESHNPLNNTIANYLTKRISSHTVPIFRQINQKIETHGTGVLVEYNDQYFLISAAHVLEDEYTDEILFHTGKTTFRNLGSHEKVLTALPKSGDRDEDKIDIGVIKLHDSSTLKELKENYQFLDIKKSINNHITKPKDDNYIVLGYPQDTTKVNSHKKEINSRVLVFFSRVSKFTQFEKYKCNKESNIFIDHPKRLEYLNEGSKIKKSGRPHGISGCGLWYISKELTNNKETINYSLIGIMIEYKVKYARVMIATKFKFVDKIIKEIFGVN